MKHLKTYKIFETIGYSELTDEMWNEIFDILLELEDEGFATSQDISDVKKVSNKLCEDVIEIVVNKKSTEDFSYNEVEDVFRRLIDYLEPYDWNYSILYFGEFHFIEFECGGKDPLAKVYNHPIEEMLYKVPGTTYYIQLDQSVEKTLTECQALKICFYQKVDHLIPSGI